MSAFRDMALDAGYRGAELAQAEAMLEEQYMAEEAARAAEYAAAMEAEEAAYYAAQEEAIIVDTWLSMPGHE